MLSQLVVVAINYDSARTVKSHDLARYQSCEGTLDNKVPYLMGTIWSKIPYDKVARWDHYDTIG